MIYKSDSLRLLSNGTLPDATITFHWTGRATARWQGRPSNGHSIQPSYSSVFRVFRWYQHYPHIFT